MNENKTKLILLIATRLSDEQCAAILERIESNPTLMANKLIACANEWDEAKHPRDDAGKFAPGGSGRGDMKKSEAQKWDDTGHRTPQSKKITQIKKEIKKLEKLRELWRKTDREKTYESQIMQKQRELAEEKRDEKLRRRLDLEHKVSRRVLKRKVAQFHDLEDEIDYMEERYADRSPDSPTQDEVVFPKSKAGEKARQKYETLKKRREELDAEIEWDKVEEE